MSRRKTWPPWPRPPMNKARVWDSSARSFPTASLWREKAVLSPFQRSLRSLPPLLGLRPTTKGAIPLGTPAALLPQISKLASVEKPCTLSRPRTSSPPPFAFAKKNCARSAAEGFLRDSPSPWLTKRNEAALQNHRGKAKPSTFTLPIPGLATLSRGNVNEI